MSIDTRVQPQTGFLERRFRLAERGSNVRKEVIGGIVTFVTMSYILFVNPSILGSGDNGLSFPQVLTVTALAAGVSTIAMGAYANYPFAIAAGLGLNAVVAFELVGGLGLSFPEAMGVVVVEGLLIALLVVLGIREAVMDAIPQVLKLSIAGGIGLFITFIGLINAGVVVTGGGTPLAFGNITTAPSLVFFTGLIVTAGLIARRVKGALLRGILGTTVLAIVVNQIQGGEVWTNGIATLPSGVGGIVAMPDFSLVGDFSFGFIGKLGFVAAFLAVITLMLADFFDTMGTAVALGKSAELMDDDGRLPGMNRVLLVDSLAAALGGAVSASSNTTYIESATGIAEDAKTGLASIVTGVLFLLALFLSPLAGVVPPQATAPALVLVGFLMLDVVVDIPWKDPTNAFPAFLTLIMMPATYSITNGIGVGFISYVVVKLIAGKVREISWIMWLLAVAFIIFFGIEPIKNALGV